MGDPLVYWLPLAAIGVLVIVGVIVWQRRRMNAYDLRRLYLDGDPTPSQDYDNEVSESSGPYCHICDTPNPAGTIFCTSCGNKLG